MKRTMMMLGAVMAWVWGVYGAKLHGIDLFHTPGCSMARDRRHAKAESAKGGWQHPPTYATAYSSFARKPLISCVEAKYEVALRGIHAAHFRLSISTRALSGASCEIEFRECAAWI